ncbi:hypothetical protein [Nocardia sp. NPDC050710]|uniref:hypothetical protein n=1 Tax=Nocardia sp. NPDC050710 TaxID=3157220 RepID=UPI0033EC8077
MPQYPGVPQYQGAPQGPGAPQYQGAPQFPGPPQHPGGAPYPPPRGSSGGRIAALVIIPLVLLLVIGVGVVVAVLLNGKAHNGSPWNPEEQLIADAFPRLVSAGNGGKGWGGTTCSGFLTNTDYGERGTLACKNETGKVSFVMRHCRTQSCVDSRMGVSKSDPGTRMSHPDVPRPLLVTDSSGTPADPPIFIGFPDDPKRSLYIVEADYEGQSFGRGGKTAADLLREWFPTAPLGP